MRRIGLLLCTIAALLLAPVAGTTASLSASSTAPGCDALCARARTELRVFTDWLTKHGAKGYVGEIGIPGNGAAAEWSALADQWYTDADAANLWVTPWATGEWWSSGYSLTTYGRSGAEGTPLDRTTAQSAVIEAHPTSVVNGLRGVNVPAGPSRAGSVEAKHPAGFSNKTLSKLPDRHIQPASLQYLASRGIGLIRLPFNWERLQPTLGGSLAGDEVSHLREIVDLAGQLGMSVVLDMHNFGGYYEYDPASGTGVRRAIGSSRLPIATFAESWKRIATAFRTAPNVIWGLMNEPAVLPSTAGRTPAQLWEAASQAAVDAIRSTGSLNTIAVPGYNYSPASRWSSIHPSPWISDSAGNIRYEAHHYWDTTGIGEYRLSYAEELAKAESQGFKPIAPATPITATGATTTPPDTGPDVAAPDVAIISPTHGRTVAGTVDIVGTIVDANPGNYYLAVVNPSGTKVAGPGSVTQFGSIEGGSLYAWNTTKHVNGTYTIKLEARDVFGNKDAGSVAAVTVTVKN